MRYCSGSKLLLKQKQHEEQAYRVCLGLLSLSRSYPVAERLNNGCAIANQNKLYRLKQIKEILRSNQDKLLAEERKATTPIMPQNHVKTYVVRKAFTRQTHYLIP